MKHIPHVLALLAVAALSACNTTQGPPAGGGYKPGESAPARISEAEAETLTTQYLDLKGQRTTMVNALNATSDPAARSRYARAIDDLSRNMQPLEYRLRWAGRPVP